MGAHVATPWTKKRLSRSRGQGVGPNYVSKTRMSPNVLRITLASLMMIMPCDGKFH